MTLHVSIVVGNPKPNSRTRKVAETLVERLFGHFDHELLVIDLADHMHEIFDWPSERMQSLNSKVAASDFAVYASPTYKATFTGLLKSFLDRYPADALAGQVAIPVLIGADLAHSMGPTVNLAPLLAELGAVVPGRGLYFVVEQMDRLDDVVRREADRYAANLRRLAHVGHSLGMAHATEPEQVSKSYEGATP